MISGTQSSQRLELTVRAQVPTMYVDNAQLIYRLPHRYRHKAFVLHTHRPRSAADLEFVSSRSHPQPKAVKEETCNRAPFLEQLTWTVCVPIT